VFPLDGLNVFSEERGEGDVIFGAIADAATFDDGVDVGLGNEVILDEALGDGEELGAQVVFLFEVFLHAGFARRLLFDEESGEFDGMRKLGEGEERSDVDSFSRSSGSVMVVRKYTVREKEDARK